MFVVTAVSLLYPDASRMECLWVNRRRQSDGWRYVSGRGPRRSGSIGAVHPSSLQPRKGVHVQQGARGQRDSGRRRPMMRVFSYTCRQRLVT
ncbi:hypothetical protein R1flu_022379 [Riccia fluitans]|uniref:Secreted protein n=1 Tax=Riccia fluitans TaxID=41844 RepID=A0ABD1ZT56_9MARC